MARKRMIDPNIWDSEDFSKLSVLGRLLFIGMFSNADDEGRGKGKAIYLKSVIFPYDESMRVSDVERTLNEIAQNMSVVFYEEGGSEYYELINFLKWQKVDKPHPSMIPPFGDTSRTLRGAVAPNRKEEKRKEVNKTEKKDARGEHRNVFLSDDEFYKLKNVCGSEQKRLAYIERLSGWLEQIGVKKASIYSSHYATIANWVRRDHEKTGQPETSLTRAADEESLLRVKEFLREKKQNGNDSGKTGVKESKAAGKSGGDTP